MALGEDVSGSVDQEANRAASWLHPTSAPVVIATLALALAGVIIAFLALRQDQTIVINDKSVPTPAPTSTASASSSCAKPMDRFAKGGSEILDVRIDVDRKNDRCWVPHVYRFSAWQTVTYLITYKNSGQEEQKDVVARVNLPAKMTLVPKSTYLFNGNNPKGVLYKSDNLPHGGIVIGSYGPGANAFIRFKAILPTVENSRCGPTTFRTVGVIRPKGENEFYNIAYVDMYVQCPAGA